MDTDAAYDIAIVGAGLVGLTLANLLSSYELKVAIIDSKPIKTQWDKSQPELRVSAINRASEIVFRQLGIWPLIENKRISPYRYMHVWDASGNGKIDFDAAQLGETNLGHIIENQVMIDALIEKLQQAENIDYFAPIKLQELSEFDDSIELVTESGQHIMTKLLVGADGANSWVRQEASIELKQKDYQHHAIIANIQTQQPHQYTAWQRFQNNGVLALLPLQNQNICSIVWSVKPKIAEELMDDSDEAFNQKLSDAFEHKLGELNVISKRACFPLTMRHSKEYIKPRIALVGDAAHTIHPLAGQGVNLGLQDAVALAEVISYGLTKEFDLGDYHLLRRYQRSRIGHNTKMIFAMGGFKNLFSNQAKPIQHIRNLGLNLTNQINPIKYQFARQALGL